MTTIDFASLVEKGGYEWVPANEWNAYRGECIDPSKEGKPIWRERPPWNIPHPPRILLRPAYFQFVVLTNLGTFEDKKSGTKLIQKSRAGVIQAESFEDALRNIAQQHSRVVHPKEEDSALFRNFARLEANEETILQFANRYGLLWGSMIGVPFAEWEYEIYTMQFLVNMWDAVIDEDTDALANSFKEFRDGFRYRYVDLLGYDRYKRPTPSPQLTATFGQGTRLEVARGFVIAAVNARLRALGGHFELTTKQLKTKHSPTASSVLGWLPNNLLGAMWLQFAESISGFKRYRQCDACQRYIELSPDVNRADRRYCSDACRNRALRGRRKLARDMRKIGKSLREISRVTGSEITTLKQWLE